MDPKNFDGAMERRNILRYLKSEAARFIDRGTPTSALIAGCIIDLRCAIEAGKHDECVPKDSCVGNGRCFIHSMFDGEFPE